MFITVEGPEGSGKSSACKRIYEELLHRGYDVILTREPGGIPIAESIREIILNKNVLKQMGINSSKISVKDTQSKIYNEILKLVK